MAPLAEDCVLRTQVICPHCGRSNGTIPEPANCRQFCTACGLLFAVEVDTVALFTTRKVVRCRCCETDQVLTLAGTFPSHRTPDTKDLCWYSGVMHRRKDE